METTVTVTIVFTFTASDYRGVLPSLGSQELSLVDRFMQDEVPLPKNRRLLSVSMVPASTPSREREHVRNLLKQYLTTKNQEETC